MELTGAQLFVKALKEESVTTLFAYPGGQAIDLFNALYGEKDIDVILPRHEQGLVHAADGYARSTGKVGVCLVTSGPGATHLVTGIATANYELPHIASIQLITFCRYPLLITVTAVCPLNIFRQINNDYARLSRRCNSFAANAKIIHIDIDAASIFRNIVVDVPIIADAKKAICALLEKAKPLRISEWTDQINHWKMEYPIEIKKTGLTPQMIIQSINELFRDAIVTTDVGQNQLWTTQFLEIDGHKKMLTSGGLGTMGYGFPAAERYKIRRIVWTAMIRNITVCVTVFSVTHAGTRITLVIKHLLPLSHISQIPIIQDADDNRQF